MRNFIRNLTAVGIAVICSCSPQSFTEQQAKNSSDDFMKSKYALNGFSGIDVKAREAENHWTFIYSPDENSTGGDHFVVVDKRTGKVIKHWGSQ